MYYYQITQFLAAKVEPSGDRKEIDQPQWSNKDKLGNTLKDGQEMAITKQLRYHVGPGGYVPELSTVTKPVFRRIGDEAVAPVLGKIYAKMQAQQVNIQSIPEQ